MKAVIRVQEAVVGLEIGKQSTRIWQRWSLVMASLYIYTAGKGEKIKKII